MTARHHYFAYGSNLSVRQMAQRCPDATDPQPATLADHDWLINERGVATVEPQPGGVVHGVLWRVSDHDLATLDSAEGVPVRYRRDALPVHTAHGQRTAWCTSTIASSRGHRAPVTWNESSRVPSTTVCRTAGSTSSSDGT